MVLHSTLCLDSSKQSAKGTTKCAQRHLTNSMYKETLLSGTVLRPTNTRIVLNYHKLFKVVVNKISLSPFDKKRYIGEDKIYSLPFRHWSLRGRNVCEGNFAKSGLRWKWPGGKLPTCSRSPTFEPPNMGFFQRHYSQSEFQSDFVDFDNLSDVSEQVEIFPTFLTIFAHFYQFLSFFRPFFKF